jgi:predicted NAD-dependent protein-ADP-ribosyltransferase YbiA (DUF1768 family)
VREIRFYRASDKTYGVFSNLFRSPIVFEDEVYPTAEHAYQAGKARRKEVRDWLMAAHGLYYWDIVPGWSVKKFDRMKAVLVAKFTQHADLRRVLLDTKDARLVEAATVDSPVNRVWGEVNGIGKNMLGILLMEVREQLRAGLQPPSAKKPRRAAAKNPANQRIGQ